MPEQIVRVGEMWQDRGPRNPDRKVEVTVVYGDEIRYIYKNRESRSNKKRFLKAFAPLSDTN